VKERKKSESMRTRLELEEINGTQEEILATTQEGNY